MAKYAHLLKLQIAVALSFLDNAKGVSGGVKSEMETGLATMGSGTDSDEIDRVLCAENTALGAGATDTVDLASYTDPAGNAGQSMAVACVGYIKNTGTTNLEIGGTAGGNNLVGTGFLKDASDVYVLGPGQALPIYYPTGITVGANGKIYITEGSGGSAGAYRMAIGGRSV